MNLRAWRILLALSAAVSCTANDATPRNDRVVISDSAGVQIVQNTDAALDTGAVAVTEFLRIGEVDGPEEYQFHTVRDIAIMDDGRLFVANNGSKTIRIYSREGRFQKEFGGPGTGPGEFSYVAMPFVWRDTVFAVDLDGNRLASLFDTTGVLLASFRHGFHGWGYLTLLAGTSHGWLASPRVFHPERERNAIGKAIVDTVRIGLIHPSLLPQTGQFSAIDADTTIRTVVRYPGTRYFGMAAREGGEGPVVALMNPPFWEPSPSSRISSRGWIFVARGYPYVVDVYDLDGKHFRSVRRAHQPFAITDAHVDELMKHVNAHYDTIGNREMNLRRRFQKQATFPRIGFLPVTSRMVTDDHGTVWVQRVDIIDNPVELEKDWGSPPPRPTYWDVFDSTGTFQHIVRLPPRFALRAVRDSIAIGVGRDDLDVQYVVGYRITRRREP